MAGAYPSSLAAVIHCAALSISLTVICPVWKQIPVRYMACGLPVFADFKSFLNFFDFAILPPSYSENHCIPVRFESGRFTSDIFIFKTAQSQNEQGPR